MCTSVNLFKRSHCAFVHIPENFMDLCIGLSEYVCIEA